MILGGSQTIKTNFKKRKKNNTAKQFKNKKKQYKSILKIFIKYIKVKAKVFPFIKTIITGTSAAVPYIQPHPQAHWQNHLFTTLWKANRAKANLISGQLMFHRVGAMAEKPLPGSHQTPSPWLTGPDGLDRYNVITSLDWGLSIAAISWSFFISQLIFSATMMEHRCPFVEMGSFIILFNKLIK